MKGVIMKPKFIEYYMKFAELTSTLSYAKRLQVGAVLVRDHKVLSTGYNGMPTDWENNCEFELEDGSLKTKPEVLHSEMNALMKVAQSTESSAGATLFCTHAPCMDCAKAIYQAGISTVYYKETYRSEDGLNFLKKSGINVHQYTDRT
jgi:dCMP deaminase